MNLDSALRFIIFLVIFGFTNYLMMLKRYEKDSREKKLLQKRKISNLYPKGTFISF